MKSDSAHRLLGIQTAMLLAGTLFAFYTIVSDFIYFFNIEGTIFRIQDCAVPNPVTTPCFYGAFAFLIALIWSYAIYRKKVANELVMQKRLSIFVLAGALFAATNAIIGITQFYAAQSGNEPTVGCSGHLVTNPFITPCTIGASLFVLSLFLVIASWLQLRKQTSLPADQA